MNFNIPQHFKSVEYQTIDDCIDIILRLDSPFLSKTDIKDAFRLLPLRPEDYYLTGMHWNGLYYFDKCLPMGCASSCQIFERFSDSIQWIMEHKYNIISVKVLDDFLFISPNLVSAQNHLNTFFEVSDAIQLPLADLKTVYPTTTLTFLGIEIDSIDRTLRIPDEKLYKYLHELELLINSNDFSLRDLRSIIGKLQHCCTIIKSGRAFLRRLYNLTMGKNNPNHILKISDSVRADLLIWRNFLLTLNKKVFMNNNAFVSADDLNMHTDASSYGYGATYGSHWFQGQWPNDWQSLNITILEMYPIYMLIGTFKEKLANSKVQIFCDNEAVVYIINKLTSKNNTVMSIVRPLTLMLLKNNITLIAEHIPGKNNLLCDFLSRQVVRSSGILPHHMRRQPELVPWQVLPGNFALDSKAS